MNQLLNMLVLLLLSPLLFSFWLAGLNFIATIPDIGPLTWFIAGLLVSVVIGLLATGVFGTFFQVSTHELTHAAAGVALSYEVKRLQVDTAKGGATTWDRSNNNALVTLAPYYLPLLTIPFLIAKPLVAGRGETANMVVDLLIGLTLGFHYAMHMRQFSARQSDLTRVGVIPSIGFTYTLMLLFLLVSITVVVGSYDRLLDVAGTTFGRAPEYYGVALDWLGRAADEVGRLL